MKKLALISLMLFLQIIGATVFGETIRKMHFLWEAKEKSLDVEIEYEDPSDVNVLLGGSRVIVFELSVTNISEEKIPFRKADLILNVFGAGADSGILLKPESVEAVIKEIQESGHEPSFLDRALGITIGRFDRFPRPGRRQLSIKGLEKHLKKQQIQDGEIKPGKRRKGLVFFMHPGKSVEIVWADLELQGYSSQALEVKGFGVQPRTGSTGWLPNMLNRLFKGEPPFEKSYALVIGIGEYKSDKFKDLDSPREDVKKMMAFLDWQGFEVIHNKTDGEVTRENLRYPEGYMGKEIGPNDRFLFYYSGHGTSRREDGKVMGYLPLSDAQDEYDEDNCIEMKELVGWIRELEAKQILIVLDSCFSGLAIGTETKSPDLDRLMDDEVLREIASLPARFVLTAGREGQRSIGGGEWGGSLFTDFFIRGAGKEADLYDDGIITIGELREWLQREVPKEAATAQNTKLIPWFRDLLAEDDASGASPGTFFFLENER